MSQREVKSREVRERGSLRISRNPQAELTRKSVNIYTGYRKASSSREVELLGAESLRKALGKKLAS